MVVRLLMYRTPDKRSLFKVNNFYIVGWKSSYNLSLWVLCITSAIYKQKSPTIIADVVYHWCNNACKILITPLYAKFKLLSCLYITDIHHKIDKNLFNKVLWYQTFRPLTKLIL